MLVFCIGQFRFLRDRVIALICVKSTFAFRIWWILLPIGQVWLFLWLVVHEGLHLLLNLRLHPRLKLLIQALFELNLNILVYLRFQIVFLEYACNLCWFLLRRDIFWHSRLNIPLKLPLILSLPHQFFLAGALPRRHWGSCSESTTHLIYLNCYIIVDSLLGQCTQVVLSGRLGGAGTGVLLLEDSIVFGSARAIRVNCYFRLALDVVDATCGLSSWLVDLERAILGLIFGHYW